MGILDLLKTSSVSSSVASPEPANKEPSNKELALDYVMHFIGKWYKWGGDDPTGFDCSGLACEYLKAAGLMARKADNSAAQIFEMFPKVAEPYRGCLVFWKASATDPKIIHIEIMLNKYMSIGASGGGSKTLTEADAMRDNAFIKIRAIKTRDFVAGFVDPFLAK